VALNLPTVTKIAAVIGETSRLRRVIY